MEDVMTWQQREDLIALRRYGIARKLPGYRGRCPGVIKLMGNDFAECELPHGHDDDHYSTYKTAGRWHVSS
jgi:hypothetical protein